MKKFLLILALVSTATFGFSQITWDDATPDTVYTFETTPDVEVHNNVTFSDSGTYRWVRKFITTCPITSAICDKNTCYLDHVDSANFFVEANETFPMICHFYPNDNCCKHAKVELTVYLIRDPKVRSEAEYNISLWCASANVSDQTSQLKLYPNPVKNILHLEANDISFEGSTISVYNSVGNEVLNGIYSANNGFNVQNLTPGFYSVDVQTSKGIIRKRLLKL